MMIKHTHQKFVILLFVLFGLALGGCSTGRPQGFKAAEDWARGVAVGQDAAGSPDMAVDPSGAPVHVVWPVEVDGRHRFRYIQLDQLADPVVDELLEIQADRLRAPRFVVNPQGGVTLFWTSRMETENWQLWQVGLSSEGGLLGEPVRVSPENQSVGSYTAADDGAGGIFAAWDRSGASDVYAVHIPPDEPAPFEAQLIAAGGERPAMQVSSSGQLYLTWLQDGDIYLGTSRAGRLDDLNTQKVVDYRLSTGDSFYGPAVGLTGSRVYLIWSVLRQGGLEAGTAVTEYVSFPPDSFHLAEPQKVEVPYAEKPDYGTFTGGFGITQLAPPASLTSKSDFIYQPATMKGQFEQLAVALVVSQEFRRDTFDQVNLAIFEDGKYLGYLPAAKTTSLSTEPLLAADQAGNLYIVWREGYSGQQIYYTTTTPEARTVLDRVKLGDIVNAVLTGGLEGAVSVMCFPIAGLGWLFPGLILLGIWKLVREDEDLGHPVSWVFLLVAVILFQLIKFFTLPGIGSYVPFSAWMDIPAGLQTPLRVSVPLLILGAGVLAAEVFRKRTSPSTIRYYLAVTITDSLLTLAIYGVTAMGVTA